MGVLNEVIKTFDKSEEQKKEINETLDLLVQLAEARAERYEKQIEDNLSVGRILGKESTKNLFFPITSVKDRRVQYRCITKDTPTDLVSDISASVTDMVEDHTAKNIITGISNIINSSLKTILGMGAGVENFCSSTSTFIEGSGISASVSRFDCIIWGRGVKTESIRSTMNSVFTCVAYKSVVDVTKISFDDFRAVYTPFLEEGKFENPIEAIKFAKDIYDVLGGGSALTASRPINLLSSNNVLTANDLINSSILS